MKAFRSLKHTETQAHQPTQPRQHDCIFVTTTTNTITITTSSQTATRQLDDTSIKQHESYDATMTLIRTQTLSRRQNHHPVQHRQRQHHPTNSKYDSREELAASQATRATLQNLTMARTEKRDRTTATRNTSQRDSRHDVRYDEQDECATSDVYRPINHTKQKSGPGTGRLFFYDAAAKTFECTRKSNE